MAELGAVTTGLKELDRMFKILPKRVNNKIIPKALRFAAKPIVKSAKSKVVPGIKFKFKNGDESRSDELKKIKVFIRGKPGNKYAVIGPDARTISFFNLGVWLEFGTLAFRTEPLKRSRTPEAKALAGKGIGVIKHPFMRPAIEETKGVVIKRMEQKIGSEIVKEVDKILKRGKV